jgi:predicted RNA-binding Zn-ribbon protein involved in translation (DUF1610 family)
MKGVKVFAVKAGEAPRLVAGQCGYCHENLFADEAADGAACPHCGATVRRCKVCLTMLSPLDLEFAGNDGGATCEWCATGQSLLEATKKAKPKKAVVSRGRGSAAPLGTYVWRTKQGEQIPIGQMRPSHLWFAIRAFERKERYQSGPFVRERLGMLYRERERRNRKAWREEMCAEGKAMDKGLNKAPRYFVRVGGKVRPATLMEWAAWLEASGKDRTVAWTAVRPGVEVSTVFLGLDHAFGGGPPVLWETMVFGGARDGNQQRYTSEDAARAGHTAMVLEVEAAQAQADVDDAQRKAEAEAFRAAQEAAQAAAAAAIEETLSVPKAGPREITLDDKE